MISSRKSSSSLNESTSKESAVEVKKVKQKKNILKHLFFNNSKTIAELCDALFISIPTLTSHVEELLVEGWLIGEEVDTKKQGRNPTLYFINPDIKHILIIDITIHSTRLAVVNFKNETVLETNIESGIRDDESFVSEVLTEVDALVKSFSMEGTKEIIGVGLTLPGLINNHTGQNKTYKKLSLNGETLNQKLQDVLDVPVFVLNDSKATVFGELNYGVGKDVAHVLSINVDWGVGLAVIINGQILNGASGFAGELGHIQVNPDGELCRCGKIGCLDTIASASSLLNKVKTALLAGEPSSLSKYKENLEEINLEMVIDAARNGDGFAIDCLYTIGIELGKGLSVAVHLFNPEIIVIDGVLSKAGNLIVNPVEFAINKYCLADFKESLNIKVTELGERAKILGTSAFVAKKLFKNE